MTSAIRICLSLTVALLLCPTSVLGQDEMVLIYDATDGSMELDPGGATITTLEIQSASGIFTGPKPDFIQPPFDVFTPVKFFVLRTDGLQTTEFGPIATPGLDCGFIGSDLTVNGSILPAGGLPSPRLVCLPEPASICLALMGFAVLLMRRKR